MNPVEEYQANFSEYLRLKASRHYGPALTSLDAAITVCPIDQAIPVLERLREELEPLTRPAPVWKRLLGWQG